MKLLFVVLCALVAVSNGEVDQRIVGGTDATYGEHPYICSLQITSSTGWFHICGCVIWNQNYVVTAAHCVSELASKYRVVVGNHQMSSDDTYQKSHGVYSYIKHPNYNGNAAGYPNDIAVMRLSSTIDFNSHVHSFEFASSGSFAGHSCKLSGWGRLSGGGSTPSTLQKVNMTKITNAECASRWSLVSGTSINDGHICFFEADKSACSGDSGGPVRCGHLITGVTSWGISSCSGSYPSVYTRLSYFYNWIVSQAGPQ